MESETRHFSIQSSHSCHLASGLHQNYCLSVISATYYTCNWYRRRYYRYANQWVSVQVIITFFYISRLDIITLSVYFLVMISFSLAMWYSVTHCNQMLQRLLMQMLMRRSRSEFKFNSCNCCRFTTTTQIRACSYNYGHCQVYIQVVIYSYILINIYIITLTYYYYFIHILIINIHSHQCGTAAATQCSCCLNSRDDPTYVFNVLCLQHRFCIEGT